MRTSVGQDRLTGLALLHIHYSLELDLDEIITIFARKHPQQMLLADILSDNPTAKLTSICKIVSAQCYTFFFENVNYYVVLHWRMGVGLSMTYAHAYGAFVLHKATV